MSEDRWKIKTLASETSKGVIWCCRVPPKGSPQVIPLSPPSLAIVPIHRDDGEFFYRRASADAVALYDRG